jgi:hypothetical protein
VAGIQDFCGRLAALNNKSRVERLLWRKMNEEKQRQPAGVLFFKVTVALPELPSPLFAVAIAHTFPI